MTELIFICYRCGRPILPDEEAVRDGREIIHQHCEEEGEKQNDTV